MCIIHEPHAYLLTILIGLRFDIGMRYLCPGKITELRDLVNELSTVSQWYLLGIYLGLHSLTLDTINADYNKLTECRMQMLIEWQRCVIPTWPAVVKALVGIGRERLASHLATKYGMLDLALYPCSSCVTWRKEENEPHCDTIFSRPVLILDLT